MLSLTQTSQGGKNVKGTLAKISSPSATRKKRGPPGSKRGSKKGAGGIGPPSSVPL